MKHVFLRTLELWGDPVHPTRKFMTRLQKASATNSRVDYRFFRSKILFLKPRSGKNGMIRSYRCKVAKIESGSKFGDFANPRSMCATRPLDVRIHKLEKWLTNHVPGVRCHPYFHKIFCDSTGEGRRVSEKCQTKDCSIYLPWNGTLRAADLICEVMQLRSLQNRTKDPKTSPVHSCVNAEPAVGKFWQNLVNKLPVRRCIGTTERISLEDHSVYVWQYFLSFNFVL